MLPSTHTHASQGVLYQDKKTYSVISLKRQQNDIKQAKELWQEYKKRIKEG
jgi:hypothetical protein